MARESFRISDRGAFDAFWARGVELWRSDRLRSSQGSSQDVQPTLDPRQPALSPPIDQQVWWQYANGRKGAMVDVIVEPRVPWTDAERNLNARVIGERPGERRAIGDATSLAVRFGYLALRLDYERMVTRLLPLTSWGDLLAQAKALSSIQRRAAMRAFVGEDDELPASFADAPSRTRVVLLGWLLLLLAVCEPNESVDSPTITLGARSRSLRRVDFLLAESADPLVLDANPLQGTGPTLFDIGRVMLNRSVRGSVTRSVRTVKVDATRDLFGVRGENIRWAVVDSGIDARHTAFRRVDPKTGQPFPDPFMNGGRTFNYTRVTQAFDFARLRPAEPERKEDRRSRHKADAELPGDLPLALDLGPELYEPPENPHGTHVAGIIGGSDGLCPEIELIDYRVLDARGRGNEFSVVTALRHLLDRIQRGGDPSGRSRDLPIHGVNLSLSLDVDVTSEACGWSLVCRACDDLVRAGVVVVVSAGNTGFEDTAGRNVATGQNYRTVSITDPGNTERVITVGATDADRPREYGVSYFSARGPTADGRPKPDLVAPGNAIRSAYGYRSDTDDVTDSYVTLDGTSQAAAHVSGCAAILLSRHRELIGRPEDVKRILMSSATDLGRDRSFQGAGLVDALRAVQSI